METFEAYAILKKYFGNHSVAAKHIGLTPEHYRAIRNGRVSIPPRTRDLIILKAQEAAGLKKSAPMDTIAREPEFVRV